MYYYILYSLKKYILYIVNYGLKESLAFLNKWRSLSTERQICKTHVPVPRGIDKGTGVEKSKVVAKAGGRKMPQG